MSSNAPLIRRAPSRDRGAGTLQWVAMMLIAAVIIVAIGRDTAPVKNMADSARRAICAVASLVGIACDSGGDETPKDPPTDPCVVSRAGGETSKGVSVVVDVGEGKGLLIEKLSNGQYKITEFDIASVEASTGASIGGGVTVDDWRAGAALGASIGGGIVGESGKVWVVDSKGAMISLAANIAATHALNSTIPHLGDLARWVGDKTGVYDVPTPTSTYVGGGVTASASANVDGLLIVGGAEASAEVTEVLGVMQNSDGSKTTYAQVDMEASFNYSVLGLTADTNTAAMVSRVEVTQDKAGTVTSMTYTLIDPVSGEELTYKLPAKTDADRALISNFLVNPNAFFQAAKERGDVTRVTYNKDGNHEVTGFLTVNVEGLEIGLDAAFNSTNEAVQSAQYWDGSKWVDWEACR